MTKPVRKYKDNVGRCWSCINFWLWKVISHYKSHFAVYKNLLMQYFIKTCLFHCYDLGFLWQDTHLL